MDDSQWALSDLSGRHILVTGASRGIGAAIAAHLARCGAAVALGARTDNAMLAAHITHLRQLSVIAVPAVGDITTDTGARAATNATADGLGTLDGPLPHHPRKVGPAMPIIRVRAQTSAPPTAVRAALTNFSDLTRRAADWPNIDPKYLAVHDQGLHSATVTEGASFAGGIWEKVRYDWTDPDIVRLDVLDSNAFAPGSSWTYTTTPRGDGGTVVALVVDRRPRTAKGRLLAVPLRLFGRRIFRADLERSLRHLENHETEHDRG